MMRHHRANLLVVIAARRIGMSATLRTTIFGRVLQHVIGPTVDTRAIRLWRVFATIANIANVSRTIGIVVTDHAGSTVATTLTAAATFATSTCTATSTAAATSIADTAATAATVASTLTAGERASSSVLYGCRYADWCRTYIYNKPNHQ